MKLRLEEVMGQNFAIIGNYPYNISSQIVFKMLECRQFVPEMVGMFQKEMAERIVAPPGNKTYGVISVLTQAFYDGKLLFNVKPGSFNPPPRVMSAVIRLTRKPDYETLGCDHKLFKTIVKLTFGQRRKMLRNTMKSLINDSEVLEMPIFKERPEQLSVQDFVGLANLVEKLRKEAE
jgi:16S rRNA (adenine1518-N6/adenine1519-N6)-dimethyltransferase